MDPAEKLASKQKQVSISEFFEKNKHFLGFDSLKRSVITAVKESVDNSLDACEESRILPEIRVEIQRLKDDRLRLITQDNGPGIPANFTNELFDAFVTTKPKGSGLGLALVAKMVDDHGGVIEFDSQPGRTEFRVMLPVVGDQ